MLHLDLRGVFPRVELRNGSKGKEHLHRLVARDVMGLDMDGLVIHHRDHDKLNNDPENLEPLASQAEHARRHAAEEVARGEHVFQTRSFPKSGSDNPMHKDSPFWRDSKRVNAYRQKQSQIMRKDRNPTEMQKKSTRQRYLNQGWRLINAGYDIATPTNFLNAYQDYVGRIPSKPGNIEGLERAFGSYSDFLATLDRENHKVVSVSPCLPSEIFILEEAPDTDMAGASTIPGIVVWPCQSESFMGSGIVISC